MKSDSKIKSLAYKIANWIVPDSIFIRLKYKNAFGCWPNLKDPKTFNEKLSWLKLHDHNPLYTVMVDKYEAKRYIAGIIGEEYIIPTYGIWDKAEDIDFDTLPNKFVLKATHDSGRVIICKDKSTLDKSMAIAEMRKSLCRNFYAVTREWPYKNVKPRIISEHLLEVTDSDSSINDYKFFCFNGRVEFMKIDFDRNTSHRANYYDRNFKLLEFGEEEFPPDSTRSVDKPVCFEQMITLAEKIAQKIRFVRVDFYEINGHVFFGESTFYPASGVGRFTPLSADFEIGKLLRL